MFKLTIEGDTLEDLAANVVRIAGNFGTVAAATPAPKKTSAKKQPVEPAVLDDEPVVDDEDNGITAEDLDVPPQPEGSTAIVDAGTGQPAPKAEAPVKMTFDDVKAAAAKLSVKDTPKLAEILKKYDAGKLSEVDKAKLGDFAADVLEALG